MCEHRSTEVIGWLGPKLGNLRCKNCGEYVGALSLDDDMIARIDKVFEEIEKEKCQAREVLDKDSSRV